jgi:hypothetical protein
MEIPSSRQGPETWRTGLEWDRPSGKKSRKMSGEAWKTKDGQTEKWNKIEKVTFHHQPTCGGEVQTILI